MHVGIHTTGQYEFARRVDLGRRLELSADLDDRAAGDTNVGDRAIEQGPIPNGQVCSRHGSDRRVREEAPPRLERRLR